MESWFWNSWLKYSTAAELWRIEARCNWEFFIPGTSMEKIPGYWDFYTGSWTRITSSGRRSSIRSKREWNFFFQTITQDSGIPWPSVSTHRTNGLYGNSCIPSTPKIFIVPKDSSFNIFSYKKVDYHLERIRCVLFLFALIILLSRCFAPSYKEPLTSSSWEDVNDETQSRSWVLPGKPMHIELDILRDSIKQFRDDKKSEILSKSDELQARFQTNDNLRLGPGS